MAVHVEAAEDEESYLTAIRVELLKDAAQTASAEPPTRTVPASQGDQADTARPAISKDPLDAPDRPILRRGVPKKTSSDDNDAAAPK